MKNHKFVFFIIIIFSMVYPLWSQDAQSAQKFYQDAEVQRNNGKKDAAKLLYEKAAAMGSADAHFALTYFFVIDPASAKNHLREAALLGHQKSLDYLIEYMFSCAYSRGGNRDLTLANPVELLRIINSARTRFPHLTVDARMYKAISYAAEAGDLDLRSFLGKYNIPVSSLGDDMYFLWDLAEDASRSGGIIPGPNMQLTLQLVARGGSVPAETELAVEFAYNCWKSGTNKDFNIGDYVTSGMGINYVTARNQASFDAAFSDQYNAILGKIPANGWELFANTRKAAEAFLESKIWNEEGHDGSGYYTWAMESFNDQRQEFFAEIDGLLQRKININSAKDNENELNSTYRRLIDLVKSRTIKTGHFTMSEEGIRATERLWLEYRTRYIAFLKVLRPDISGDNVRIWLNQKRIKNFEETIELSYYY